jgi:hypothetical protein
MKHYAGLDVSLKETSICILDEAGKICREIRVASHPEDLLRILQDPAWHLEDGAVDPGLVGDPFGWRHSLLLEQLAHQLPGSGLVPPGLDQHVEDLAFGIDRPPQVHLLAADPDETSRPDASGRAASNAAPAVAARS